MQQLAKEIEIIEEDIFDFSPDMIQRLLYKCQFCNFFSAKHLWGPGRIWCPTCFNRQLSPAEIENNWTRRSEYFNSWNPTTGKIT